MEKEYYGIKNKGSFYPERVATLPTWTPADERRLVYDNTTKSMYYGSSAAWRPFPSVVISGSAALEKALWFPEICNAAGTLSITASTGQVVVDIGTYFICRATTYNTSDNTAFPLVARTRSGLVANQTYHLRFAHQVTDGSGYSHMGQAFYAAKSILKGLFYIVRVDDAYYNPSSMAETDPAFDSKYDDMLIAKVVTNSSNIPTVTALKNKKLLNSSANQEAELPANAAMTEFYVSDFGSLASHNWARTPVIQGVGLAWYRSASLASCALGTAQSSHSKSAGGGISACTRYSVSLQRLMSGTLCTTKGGHLVVRYNLMA